jgi:hypothetical protein
MSVSWFQQWRNAAAQMAAKAAAKRALEQLGQVFGAGEEEEEVPESSTEKALKARARRDQEAMARWKEGKEEKG